jgi:MFS family permease
LSKEYWRFWAAAALSNLGDGIRLTALPLLATQITDSAVAISAVAALSTLPWIIVGPLGGVVVDRVDRRTLMVWGQVARAASIGVLAAWASIGDPPLALIFVVTFLVGTGEVFVDTASQAAIPMLAPDTPEGLERANGRLIAAQTLLDQVAGPPVGAALFAIGAVVPFAFDAGTFLLSAVLLLTVRVPLQPPREITTTPTTVRADLAEGFSALWQSDLLRNLAIGVGLINASLSAGFAVLVILVLDELGGTAASYGAVLGIGAIGGFAGALVTSHIVKRIGRRATITTTSIAGGATVGAMAVVPNLVVLAVIFFASTFAVVVFNITGQSIRQAATPPHLLGRVVASFRLIGLLGSPVGAIAGGAITEFTTVRTNYVVAGVFAILPTVVFIRATQHLPSDPGTATPDQQ